MARSLGSQSHIVIVDTRPQDYHGLTTIASQCQWNIHFLTHGRAAIRFAQPDRVELSLINPQLPDISGFDLVSQLRTRCGGASVFVVSDQYHASEEARACSQGANLYLTKDNNCSLDCDQL